MNTKDEGSKVLKLFKTNSAFNFLKNNTSWACASEGIIFDKIQGIVFWLLQKFVGGECKQYYSKA